MKLSLFATGWFVFLCAAWFTAGFSIANSIASKETKEFMKPFDAALAKCELNLPRNQSCVLVYEAKVKE